ncbi:MAG: hypothetical protein ACI9MC_003244, partial [Kiritimatiellia bacterium]
RRHAGGGGPWFYGGALPVKRRLAAGTRTFYHPIGTSVVNHRPFLAGAPRCISARTPAGVREPSTWTRAR